MNTYRADLHIHTVLSPCGDLEMSPKNIVSAAARKGLDIIAICDHNHTGHARLTRQMAEERGIWVVYGAELTSFEEVHCLTFFESDDQLEKIQQYIEDQQPIVQNDTSLFGYQVIVDAEEQILEEVSRSLYPSLKAGMEDIAKFVHEIGGLFVPAHVDRKMNGMYAQMGFCPEGLQADAIEIHRNTPREDARHLYPELERFQFVKSSDAHYIEDVGRCVSELEMDRRDFLEFSKAVRGEEGRRIVQE